MIKKAVILACAVIIAGCASRSQPQEKIFIPPVFSSHPEILAVETAPGIYYVRGHVNIFLYDSQWYYYYNNVWHAGSSYNGPWVVIETHKLPVRFGQIPPGHLRNPPGKSKLKPKPSHNMPPGFRDTEDDGPGR